MQGTGVGVGAGCVAVGMGEGLGAVVKVREGEDLARDVTVKLTSDGAKVGRGVFGTHPARTTPIRMKPNNLILQLFFVVILSTKP